MWPLWRRLYSFCFILALPVLLLRLLWRSRRMPAYRQRLKERLGLVPVQVTPAIWLHAVSVGEVVAAVPLVQALRRQFPDKVVIVTTTTPTGSQQLLRLLGDTVLHYYLPYDCVGFLQRFVRRLSIELCVIMETEIWPNLLYSLDQLRVPVLLANARLSARSEKGYARLNRVMPWLLPKFQMILTQGQRDAAAFLRLGVAANKVQVAGNMKYDLTPCAKQLAQGLSIKQSLGGRTVWIAASTHSGEEGLLLDVHQDLLKQHPGVLLIIVPRHPERFDSVEKLIQQQGFCFQRRSQQPSVSAQTQVYLADTMGELFSLYAASDIAFVGGSWVEVGGHNFLEPALLKKPLMSGPYLHNFIEMRDQLLSVEGLQIVKDPSALLLLLQQWVVDAGLRQHFGQSAFSVIDANKGAVEQHLQYITTQLGC